MVGGAVENQEDILPDKLSRQGVEEDGVFGRLARPRRRGALRFRLMVNVVCVGGSHTHQMEKRSMKHYAGLDISVKETSVCLPAHGRRSR
jgi:hypothetical protein